MQNLFKTSADEWELLNSLVTTGYFSTIDLALAKELSQDSTYLESGVVAFLCYLSLAVRRGHLCIQIKGKKIFPDPFSLCNQNRSVEGEGLHESSKELLQQVADLISWVSDRLPEKLVTPIHSNVVKDQILAVQTPLCRMGDFFYFQRYWYYESLFLYYYQRFANTHPKIALSKEKMVTQLEQIESNQALLPEQRAAILNACHNALTIICGGPGTGKTYTAGVLIRALWESLADFEREKFEISLAAPTGKAAANLKKSLLRSARGVSKLSNLQSKTLHALLGIKREMPSTEPTVLSSDLVIVDESSMIDVRLMASLFAAMKPGARLILLGDEHQLPAVEAGSLFAELVNGTHQSNLSVNKLTKCLRAELQGILSLAAAINRGDVEATLKLCSQEECEGVQRLKLKPFESQEKTTKEFGIYAFNCFQMDQLAELQPSELINHFNRFRLLSPLRKGPFGVEEINRQIVKAYKAFLAMKGLYSSSFIVPIMLLKNDYRLELFNGEVGVLVKRGFKVGRGELELESGDVALFSCNENGVRQIPALLLPQFEYAYCLSVHKSQGSEFDHVLLLLPPGSEHFGRELFYTGVTRARQQLTLWAEDEVLSLAIQSKNFRFSGINQRLQRLDFPCFQESLQPHFLS